MLKVETGYQTSTAPSITRTTVSVVDTLYTPCGCSPLGKTWKVSLPHAPGGTVYWTEYVYDALGNLIKVTEPNPAGGDNLETTYTYSGAVGSNVYNRYSGIVLTEGNDPAGFGNYVIVDIGFGDLMLYQSGSINVQVGDGVYYGQPIGLLGQTGNAAGLLASEPHVHFEVFNNGVQVNPALFLNKVCPWTAP